jgi:hypothetical protein
VHRISKHWEQMHGHDSSLHREQAWVQALRELGTDMSRIQKPWTTGLGNVSIGEMNWLRICKHWKLTCARLFYALGIGMGGGRRSSKHWVTLMSRIQKAWDAGLANVNIGRCICSECASIGNRLGNDSSLHWDPAWVLVFQALGG